MSFTDERQSHLLPAVARVVRKASARVAAPAGVSHWLPLDESAARGQLSPIRLFAGADLDVVARVLYGCELRDLPRGHMLVSPLVPRSVMYVLLSGHLRAYRVGAPPPYTSIVGPGDCVGELGVIDRMPEPLYVVAQDPARVLVIDRETLWQLVRQSHALARNLLLASVRRVRDNSRAIAADASVALRD